MWSPHLGSGKSRTNDEWDRLTIDEAVLVLELVLAQEHLNHTPWLSSPNVSEGGFAYALPRLRSGYCHPFGLTGP